MKHMIIQNLKLAKSGNLTFTILGFLGLTVIFNFHTAGKFDDFLLLAYLSYGLLGFMTYRFGVNLKHCYDGTYIEEIRN